MEANTSIPGLPLRLALGTVIIVMFAWMFDSMDLMLLIITIRSMAHISQLNFDLYTVGALIISVALLTSGLGGILFGFIADRYGRKKTLIVSILMYSIPTFLIGFVRNWIELLILRLFSGFGVGGAWASGMTLVAETVDSRDRGKAVSIVQCGFPVGFLLAIFLAFLVAYRPSNGAIFSNWRMAFIVGAVPAILLSVLVSIFVPESKIWKFRLMRGRIKVRDVFVDRELRKRFFIGLTMDFLGMFSYWVFWSWLPSYLESAYRVGELSMLNNMFWLIATQVGALMGYLMYGFAQDHIGRRTSWSIFTAGEGALILLSIFMIDMLIRGEALPISLFFVIGFGLGYFTGFWSAFGAILSELFPTEVRGTVSGLIFNIGRSINFVSPIFVGYLAKIYGFGLALSTASIVCFMMSAIVWLLPETKGKELL